MQDLEVFLTKHSPPCVHSALNVPYSPPSPSLLLYEQVVMSSFVKWDIQLLIMAVCQGVCTPLYTPQPAFRFLRHFFAFAAGFSHFGLCTSTLF